MSESLTYSSIDDEMLRRWPLPAPAADGDKEERGRLLVIAGSGEMPGPAILAATAALRAGVGKLTIATGASIAPWVALAVPESRVVPLPETNTGGIGREADETLHALVGKADAVLIGPGMQDEASICELVFALLPKLGKVKLLLDASAMGVVRNSQYSSQSTAHSPAVLLTPHAGEMAHLSGLDKATVLAAPSAAARTAARRWNAVVALKGSITFIATPEGRLLRHDGGNVGLAISGSGDALAGIIAGLAARGAPLEQAGAWGVALHARAGEKLALRLGPLGYLAREIAAEIPALMHGLTWHPASKP
ncbi:MAG: NAD(P)H-hydrate dehydratase [Burkholderiales bacterium]|nr:NAD(P)H-hydrate dehydratase [Burkholderiales bacterium]